MAPHAGMSVAVVLLAAGLSRRFGAADKLSMALDGMPLALHAAQTLSMLPVDHRIVVTARQSLDWAGFTSVTNDRPEDGMGRSLALGVAAARASGATAALVALADMPLVSVGHFEKLLACHHDAGSIVASSDGIRRMPPALFGSNWFGSLERTAGDAGARSLLGRAQIVNASAAELADIDNLADLRAAEQALAARTPMTDVN